MQHELEVLTTPDAVAAAAADIVVQRSRAAIIDHERFTFAVSGGHTPWAMFAELTTRDLQWERIVIFQVDERVAPDGDPARNLTHLRASLGRAPAEVVPMPVTDPDLDASADRYAGLLPHRFDLIHLGLGPDGHTASLVPDDPVLKVTDHLVAVTGDYQGHPRMTLTYPALARADQLLWLVTGAEKQPALAKVLAGDESIPAGRVEARESLIVADRGASGS
ncbi:6-phosphogluconolactonase [Actinopolymorpha sp. B11F2]|uniref:6-phosphogluconolactonase n=1 Tax=Actinopolymorpha sp. B11F2 TaxID=3160862 RepID=UPI0032E4AD7F